MIRHKALFNNPFQQDVDEMAAAAWIEPADCGKSMTLSSNNRRLDMWPMQVLYAFFSTNVNHKLQIRGFHYSVRSTAVSQIGIKLTEIYQLLEMEVPKRKGKVCWLLENERYIFEKKDLEAGIIHSIVGIILILILRLTRSHTLPGTSPLTFTTVFSTRTNPQASKIHACWCTCPLSMSVQWQPLSSGTSTPLFPLQ